MTRELFDSNVAMYVLGYLMASPQTLMKERCLLTLNDFPKNVHQVVFGAISNLAYGGATKIYAQDVDLYLAQYSEQYKVYSDNSGLTLLKNLEAMDLGHDEAQFFMHYDKLKKFTVLRDLEKSNIDTREFYDPTDFFDLENQSKKLDEVTIPQILDRIRLKLAKIEKINFNKDGDYFQTADEGIDEVIRKLEDEPDIGYPIEGDILNYICRGGRRGKMYLYSAGSGGGKTRFFMQQACYRSLPRLVNDQLVMPAELEKVYFISVEQEPEELQTMILAYISGVEEHKMLWKSWTEEEHKRVLKAAQILKQYGNNLCIDRIPEPSISKVRTTIVEKILDKNIDMVVYDYIAIPEDDEGSATKRQLRSDQVLLQFSNTLKEIAVSYNIFMLTGTQITGGDVTKKMVRGFADIRDGKSIADKADFCMIGCFVTDEEYKFIETYCKELNIEQPNYVIDIYKNRDGEMTNCKIYRNFNLGTLRAYDLLATTQSFRLLNNYGEIRYGSQEVVDMVDFLTRGGSN